MGDEPTAPGYMFLYGLLMTILMAFFVLLSSMGTQEPGKKMNEVISSIKSVFGVFGEGGSGILNGGSDMLNRASMEMQLERILKKVDMQNVAVQNVSIEERGEKKGQPFNVFYDNMGRLNIEFPEDVVFDQKLQLSEGVKSLLQKILALYFDTPYGINIVGIANEKDNALAWKKGFAMATVVRDYLLSQGVPEGQLLPMGKKGKEEKVAVVLTVKDGTIKGG